MGIVLMEIKLMRRTIWVSCLAMMMTGWIWSANVFAAEKQNETYEGTWHAFGPYSQYMVCIPDEWEVMDCTGDTSGESAAEYAEFHTDMNWIRIGSLYSMMPEYADLSVNRLMNQLKKNENAAYRRYEFDQKTAMYLDYDTETETYDGVNKGISANWILDLGQDTILIDMNYLGEDEADVSRMREMFTRITDSVSLSDRDLLPPIIFTDAETVKLVQAALNEAGFECGKVDGQAGKKTFAAMEAYQTEHDLEVTTDITDDLLDSLEIPVTWGQVPEEE